MWPLTASVPKGLLPLAGLPFVEYQLRHLAAVGVTEVVLAVGRHGLPAWEAYAAGSPLGLSVRVAVEDVPLDTAGPVREILETLDERFFVLNGDVVVEADLAAVAAGSRPGTLGLIEVDDTSAYGVVVLAADGRVERFVEKPPRETAPARTVNAGMYVLTRSCLARYPTGPLSFERVVFPDLVAAGDLGGVVLSGHWLDIGTPELYLDAHAAVFHGASGVHRPEHAHVAAGADVAGDLGGAWAWVAPGARVAAGARVEEAVVMAGATVASGAVVRRAVIGPDAIIDRDAIVTGVSLVGSGAVVGAGCEIDHGMRIAPGGRLDAGSVTFRPPK